MVCVVLCLMEKDIRNTAGGLNVYFSEDIYTVSSTLKQFAHFHSDSPVTGTHGGSEAFLWPSGGIKESSHVGSRSFSTNRGTFRGNLGKNELWALTPL